MFRKTLVRLAVLNAFVIFVVLCGINVLVYNATELQVVSTMDRMMRQISPNAWIDPNTDFVRVPYFDRPLFYLMWDDRGQLMRPTALQLIDPDFAFGPLIGQETATFRLKTDSYRLITLPDRNALNFDHVSLGGVPAEIQLVANITPEINMLDRQKKNMQLGIASGIVVTVAAGFLLALQSLKPIRRSWERQHRFVSDASHELRTPLAVIRTNSEVLLRRPNQKIRDESEYIASTLKETQRLEKLVGHLLMLARTDSGQTSLNKRQFCLSKEVADTVHLFATLAESRNVVIRAEIDPSVPWIGDVDRIRQLLVIFLDNAMKYTPEGGSIRISCRKHSKLIALAVEDTGRGIASVDLPHIFDRFYRGSKHRSRDEEGTGLGLSIAKWIVDEHGGKIRIDSRLGEGTKVMVSLPA